MSFCITKLQDLSILEELMRMVLEIINSCLSNAIHHNGNLVYSILYNKSSFLQFKNHPSFQDVFENIDLVIAHFSKEIENLEDKSVEKLKEIIEFGIKQFSRERFRVCIVFCQFSTYLCALILFV